MTNKLNAEDYVNDLLSGNLPVDLSFFNTADASAAIEVISQHYEFSDEEIRMALVAARPKIEDAIGMPLTDEQLHALSGGKLSTKTSIFIGGTTVLGAGVAVGIGVALAWAIK